MYKKGKILSILIFIALSSRLFGQIGEFSHYGLNEGLSQSVINTIFQDSQGFLWFGTQNGLNRFDGYSFKKYLNNPSDPSSIVDNWIYDITEDNEGNLWIGTKKGLAKFIKKENRFEEIRYKPKNQFIPNNAVNGLFTSSKGDILINTNGMLIILNPLTLQLVHYQSNLPPDGSIYDQNRPILEDKLGNIWLGAQSGLCKFSKENKQFLNYKSDTQFSHYDLDITALFEDFNGNILVGTSNGLLVFDPLKEKFQDLIFNNKSSGLNFPIRAILKDKNGNLWVATENGGLGRIKYNGKNISLQFFRKDPFNPGGMSHNIIYSLLIDNSDILWVGTLDGINKLDLKNKKFQLYRKTNDPNSIDLADNVVAALYKDSDNQVWVGTWGSGLDIYNRETGEIRHYASKYSDYSHIPNDFVHVIFRDSHQRIWIGSRNGLLVYNYNNKEFLDYRLLFHNEKLPDFKNNRIFCMKENANNQLMIGTANGFYILDLKSGNIKSFFAQNSAISSNLVYSVLEDSDQELWIATTNGLDRYNPKTGIFKHYRKSSDNSHSLIDNFVVSLCLASDGKIWVGTNSGLCRMDKKTEKFEYFPAFPTNVVYDILEDNHLNLWLSSGLGLTMYNSKTKNFTSFGIEDGLQSLEFNIKACYKANDGEMFFGGMNGFNSFYPDSIKNSQFIPKIVITGVEKENQDGRQPINFVGEDEIILTHNDYAISIDFASLDFTNPQKNKYAYEMSGLSDKRIENGNRRHVTFLNLSPGNYEFRVYGTNSDGIWNDKPAIVKIKVLPPWWRSSYAYIAYTLSFLLIIILFIKIRERNLKLEKQVLEEKVEERTKEILRQKDEIETQKDEILAQRDEIEKQKNYVTEQRDQIAFKNEEINDSLLYAKRIQSAVLPGNRQFRMVFSDFFILYLPKAIVSGDFYWIKKCVDKYYFAVADCTGHGVPGAFVSMLGISLLNEIIHSASIDSTGDLLNKLRVKLKEVMKQTGRPEEAKDGMDISLVGIDLQKMKLEFTGANNIAILVQNKKIIQLNADKMPIGIYTKEHDFNTQVMDISKNDIIYLFSDGYIDQFGGKTRRKFMIQNFIQLLENINHLPMSEQMQRLKQTLIDWQADNEQVDDITVLGVKI